MRIRITVDSATTEEIRDLMVGLHRAGRTRTLETGVEGPERWSGMTPPLTVREFETVVNELDKRGTISLDRISARLD